MTTFQKTWKFFEGNKRNIGIIALWALKGVSHFFPQAIPLETLSYLNEGVDVLLLGGMADAYRRTPTGRKVADKTGTMLKGIYTKKDA